MGIRELKLFDPNEAFMLGIGVEVAEFVASQQKYKSINSRIARAKQGYPSCGKKPYGRIWDKKTKTWEVDEEKRAIIRKVAKLYLEGDYSWPQLGKMVGMNFASLHRNVCHRSGNKWEVNFNGKDFNISETHVLDIPPLLPEEIILAVRKKCEARRVWDFKTQKHQYLFSRLIFDAETGYALSGYTNYAGRRYYRPYKGRKNQYQLNAGVLEKAVLEELYWALGSKASLHKAIFDGNPIGRVAEQLQDELEQKQAEFKLVEKGIENCLTAIETCQTDISELLNRLKPKLADLEARSKGLKERITALEYQLNTLPNDEEIEAKRDKYAGLLREQLASSLDSGVPLLQLPFEHQKKIIRLFFGGKDELGKRYGIYVKDLGGYPRHYRFDAYGKLGDVYGWITAKTGEYFSGSTCDLILKDDKELGEGISKIVLDGDPVIFRALSEDKDHMLSECH